MSPTIVFPSPSGRGCIGPFASGATCAPSFCPIRFHPVLARLLRAAHHAPSVGFMQPWDFILIESLEVRRAVRAIYERENRKAAENYRGRRRSCTVASSWKASSRARSISASPVIAAAAAPMFWGAIPSWKPTSSVFVSRSKTCGSPPGPRASASVGSASSIRMSWRERSGCRPGSIRWPISVSAMSTSFSRDRSWRSPAGAHGCRCTGSYTETSGGGPWKTPGSRRHCVTNRRPMSALEVGSRTDTLRAPLCIPGAA